MEEFDELQGEEIIDGPLWFRCEPTKEKDMTFVSKHYTVCEVLREIYKETDSESIKMKCQIASTMAKSMAARITKYEGGRWGKRQYPQNPKYGAKL